jgi:hypothetical protein
MMTDAEIISMPDAARFVWLNSLQSDEQQILDCSTGHRYTMVVFSTIKRYLAEEDAPTLYRLKFLEYLDKLSDAWLTAEAVAMI